MRIVRLTLLLSLALAMLVPFITAGTTQADSNTRWEYYNSGNDSYAEVYNASNYFAQTFTANYSHTVDYVKLKLTRENLSSVLTMEILATNPSGYPDGEALASGTYDGALLNNGAYSWAVVGLTSDLMLTANTIYAIVVHGTGVNDSNCIDWADDITASTYSGGQYFDSIDGGSNWTANSSRDFMFEVWGENTLEIVDCRVYSSYWEADDWLVVLSYKNFYEPYYPSYNPKDYFTIDLMKNSSIVASYPLQQWGYRPGAIYLSAAEASSEEWGNTSYSVVMNGTFTANPTNISCNLTADKWKGDDLTDFDDWCMLLAGDMNDYYAPTDSFVTLSSTSQRKVLSEEAGVYFAVGIPALPIVIPEMFSTVISSLNITENNSFTMAYLTSINWTAVVGTEIATTLENFGYTWFQLPIGSAGKVMFWILSVLVFGMMAAVGVPRGHHIAGMLLALPILLACGMLYPIMVIPLFICVFLLVFFGGLRWLRGA